MGAQSIVEAILLGALEGLTEFLPVSSTGHLLLAGYVMGIDNETQAWKSFVILIQLGAILAILSVYFVRLWRIARAIPHDSASRRFVVGVLLAFLPAVVVGVLAHDFIKNVLFETPAVICTTLIIGGFVLLWVDRQVKDPVHTDATRYPLPLYFKIGLAQCVAMIPGVSRSGATIAGALLMGTDKRSAAEFSFFLAIPTMAGAFTYDLYKTRAELSLDDVGYIAVGFVAAFVAAVIVVRTFVEFVARHGFALFAYWRIAVGILGFILIFTGTRGEFAGPGGQAALPAKSQDRIVAVPAPANRVFASGRIAVELAVWPVAP